MHWGSIEIDIDIAKCFEELLKLLLILQNPLPNIDVFSISKKSVSHIPAFRNSLHLFFKKKTVLFLWQRGAGGSKSKTSDAP